MKQARIYVSPRFAKWIKKASVDDNNTVISFSEKLVEQLDCERRERYEKTKKYFRI